MGESFLTVIQKIDYSSKSILDSQFLPEPGRLFKTNCEYRMWMQECYDYYDISNTFLVKENTTALVVSVTIKWGYMFVKLLVDEQLLDTSSISEKEWKRDFAPLHTVIKPGNLVKAKIFGGKEAVPVALRTLPTGDATSSEQASQFIKKSLLYFPDDPPMMFIGPGPRVESRSTVRGSSWAPCSLFLYEEQVWCFNSHGEPIELYFYPV